MDNQKSLAQLIANGEQIARSLLEAEADILAGEVNPKETVDLVRAMRGFAQDITTFLKIIDSMTKENAHDV